MSESGFGIAKPLFVAALLATAGGGAIYWWTTQLDVAQHPEGFSVGFPPGWEQATVAGALVANGFLPQGGAGRARATWHPWYGANPRWPDEVLQSFPEVPDSNTAVEINGRRAVMVTYTTGATRHLGVAVDCGDGMVLFWIGGPTNTFEKHRSFYERSARSIQCAKP